MEYRRAVELDRGSVDAAMHYALCLHELARWDAAIAEHRRALQLDPASPRLNAQLLRVLVDSHHYKEAVEQFSKTIELDRTNGSAYVELSVAFRALGRDAEAVAACLKAASVSGGSAGQVKALEDATRAGGCRGYWRKRLEQLQEQAKSARIPPLSFASIYAQLGQKDEAIGYLEAAYRQHAPRLIWIRARSTWDPLRSEPRFQALLRRMNFPE